MRKHRESSCTSHESSEEKISDFTSQTTALKLDRGTGIDLDLGDGAGKGRWNDRGGDIVAVMG